MEDSAEEILTINMSRRLAAGIHSHLDDNYEWPRNFGQPRNMNAQENITNSGDNLEQISTTDVHPRQSEESNLRNNDESTRNSAINDGEETKISNASSRHSIRTKNSRMSKTSIDYQRIKIAFEAEKARQILLDEALREKLKLIEMEKQVREAELLDMEEERSQKSRSLSLFSRQRNEIPGIDKNNDNQGMGVMKSVTDWVSQIPDLHNEATQLEQTYEMKTNKNNDISQPRSSKDSPTVFQMNNDHLDQICGIIKNHVNPGVSGVSGIKMSTNLPIFDGNPEEWPIFYSQYKRSTDIYKICDEENIVRLQRCLKGRAKDTVQPLLIASSNAQKIIETLKFTFGRPEFIISSLIEKVRRTTPLKEGKFETYLQFSNIVESLVTTMEIFESTGHMNNPQLLNEVVVKIPPFLRIEWAKLSMTKTNVSLKDFSTWLRNIALAASTCIEMGPSDKRFHENDKFEQKRKRENIFSTKKTNYGRKSKCSCCKQEDHQIEDCAIFKKKEVNDKWKIITSEKLCFSCLRPAHNIFSCKKKKKCQLCDKFHHTSLHNEEVIRRNDDHGIEASTSNYTHAEAIHQTSREGETEILLRIIPVNLKGPGGEINTYALFDEAATTTLIESRIADEIGLDGPIEPLCYQWLNEVSRNDDSSRRVTVEISGVGEFFKTFKIVGARTVSGLSLPKQSIDVEKLAETYPYIKMTPVTSFKDAQPMILIGQDQCPLTIARKFYHGSSWNSPFVSRTLLGWVVHGTNHHTKSLVDKSLIFHLCCDNRQDNDLELHNLVKDSFKIDNFGTNILEENGKSKEDERAMKILENTIKRVGNHFEIGLLWKNKETKLPDSKGVALNRLKCMERKMDKNANFAAKYCEKIEEYLKKGYVKKLSPAEAAYESPKTWYLPHFGVINPNKPDKLRLVFDAAAKSQGVSLNDNLLQGEDMLRSLLAILWKFRQKKVAFCGDIKEMFHQVLILDEDCSAQRFFWRGMDRKKNPDVYQMKAMIFGATSSPCMAQYVKNKNAEDHANEYPEAAKAIIEKHYVDDYLDSTDTEDQAIQLISEVIKVHKNGGFQICNWISNSERVMSTIPENLRAKSHKNLDSFCKKSLERILGLWWNPETDNFTFSMNCYKVNPEIIKCTKIPTKREALKLTMSVFDPLGFLSPLVVRFKIFLQQIWRIGIGWDDTITQEMNTTWIQLVSELKKIEDITIPRCYGPHISDSNIVELHGFCDSSEKAFSAVVYLRIGHGNGFTVAFVSAKTRVAPLKPVTVPRLELQAALMLSRLMTAIRKYLEVKITASFQWTDSKTVLRYIRSQNKRYKTFVAHRVREITELTEISSWRWVPGEINVADESTRDISNDKNRWLLGPIFLEYPEEIWPKESEDNMNEGDSIEELEVKKENILLIQTHSTDYLPDVGRFSKYLKLIRSTAWMRRFIGNCRHEERTSILLETDEIVAAEECWVKHVQGVSFPEEIARLKKGGSVPKTSRLYTLNPIIDDKGILRIKGRLVRSDDLCYFQKFPMILDPKHRFTRLIIEDYHARFHHQGHEIVINELRQHFWILRLRSAVKKCKNDCFYCKKERAKPEIPEMGQLPHCRLKSFVRPFTITGMDYFGPLTVTVGRRHEKRYIVLFTCLSVRAIHLEIAQSLNTDAAIMAIRRFIGRRGCPDQIYSDNGTNLHSANTELKKAMEELENDKVSEYVTKRRIDWKFIPPASPHMGGSWERLIKCVKNVLKVSLKERSPKEEVLQTFIVEAENIVNSRPLTYVSTESMDIESLTPNHFLLSSSSGTSPLPGKFDKHDINLRKQWRVSQALADMFWRRWVKEYLPTLNKVSRWHHSQAENCCVDDVVLVVDDTTPRNTWPLGIIEKVYMGNDGKVRVVDVRTKNGSYRRPVTKICRLPHVRQMDIDDAENE